jgi:hypothetical protein
MFLLNNSEKSAILSLEFMERTETHTLRFSFAVILLGLFCGAPLVSRAQTAGTYYASPYGSRKLPDGFVVQAIGKPEAYVIKGGKKSLIFRPILDRWYREAHFFDPDHIIKLSPAELATYPDTTARNHFYMGRILEQGGKRWFIDDKLRRRPISPAVQAALKYPGRNVYAVPSSILGAFPVGPAITRTDRHPGGTVMYRGAYHGGIIYLITNDDTKREFLHDYVYEAMGFPWSSQILPVSAAELARYKRGPHISTYPDGWIIGKGARKYLTEGGRLRWIASDSIFRALKYTSRYVLTVFPEFFRNYGTGTPVTAFKDTKVAVSQSAVNSAYGAIGAMALPSTPPVTVSLRVPPDSRRMISNVNILFLEIYDRNPTTNENAFWVDYLYKGEAQTEAEFRSALQHAKTTGVRPTITSRTAALSPEKLLRYVNFLFYYVFGRFPTADEKTFWDGRITSGLRKTIEDLGGNMQFLKDQGLTMR